MPSTLPGNLHCPREHTNHIAQQCVAKYITANTCKAAGGRWTKFITNIVERTSGILSTCHAMGDMKLKRGIPYQPHKVSQGAAVCSRSETTRRNLRFVHGRKP